MSLLVSYLVVLSLPPGVSPFLGVKAPEFDSELQVVQVQGEVMYFAFTATQP